MLIKYQKYGHDYVDLPTHDSCHAIQFIVMFDDKSNDIIDI